MAEAVLDASVILAAIKREPGSELVAGLIPVSAMGAVNAAEVISKLVEWGYAPDDARAELAATGLDIIDADSDLAFHAGALRGPTRPLGLSLGDRFCLALGMRLQLPVYTAERRWLALSPSMDIRLIR